MGLEWVYREVEVCPWRQWDRHLQACLVPREGLVVRAWHRWHRKDVALARRLKWLVVVDPPEWVDPLRAAVRRLVWAAPRRVWAVPLLV